MDLPWYGRNVVTPALLKKGVYAGTPTSLRGGIGGEFAASQIFDLKVPAVAGLFRGLDAHAFRPAAHVTLLGELYGPALHESPHHSAYRIIPSWWVKAGGLREEAASNFE